MTCISYRGQMSHWMHWQARWLSTLQCSSGYSQVSENSQDKHWDSIPNTNSNIVSFRFYTECIRNLSMPHGASARWYTVASPCDLDNRIIHAKSFSYKLKLRCCFQEAPSGRTKSQSKNVPLVPETYYLPWSSGKQGKHLHQPREDLNRVWLFNTFDTKGSPSAPWALFLLPPFHVRVRWRRQAAI